MSEERVLTLHPEGKEGVNIEKAKYDLIREAILNNLDHDGNLTFTELVELIDGQLSSGFGGSVTWYVTTVKLDLEARREIERVPGSSPQRLRLVD